MTNDGDVLASGTRLDEYEIERVLGMGGFGVTYLARDAALERRVAIKEYLPSQWGSRRTAGDVGPRSKGHAKDYEWGLKRFLDEARILANLEHPQIVRVHRVIKARGTAYMVMEYIEGRNLAEELKDTGPLPEARVRAILAALMSGLAHVHAAKLVHRDIKPANVMLRPDGAPVLIDFGAARQAVGQQSLSLTAVLSPGYAPWEQYSTAGEQGPWTDIYALGAVAYKLLTGRTPDDATARMAVDALPPVEEAARQPVSATLSSAIAAALKVRPEDRPQSLAAWQDLLDPSPTAKAPPRPIHRRGGERERPKRSGASPVRRLVLGGLVLTTIAVLAVMLVNSREEAAPEDRSVEMEFWQSIDARTMPDLLEEYLRRWPDGEFVSVAEAWLDQIRQANDTAQRQAAAEEQRGEDTAQRQAAAEEQRREDTAQRQADAEEQRGEDTAQRQAAAEEQRGEDTAQRQAAAEEQRREDTAQRQADAEAERTFWAVVERTEAPTPGLYEDYLRRWPDGQFAEDASKRLEELRLLLRPLRVFRDCEEMCPEVVVLPAGTFRMGATDGDDNERPVHEVHLEAFAIGRYEVTYQEWEACAANDGCGGNPRPNDQGWGRERRPVINVRWEDAQEYVRWLTRETGKPYRLPSEAEWEYAARARTTTRRPWGDDERRQCRYANGGDRTGRERYRQWMSIADCADGHVWTAPVGSYLPNPFGLYDMLGNVWEWVEDCWHETYAGAPSDGAAWVHGGDCGSHVIRGGSWLDDPSYLRPARRLGRGGFLEGYHDNRGFRVARSLEQGVTPGRSNR